MIDDAYCPDKIETKAGTSMIRHLEPGVPNRADRALSLV